MRRSTGYKKGRLTILVKAAIAVYLDDAVKHCEPYTDAQTNLPPRSRALFSANESPANAQIMVAYAAPIKKGTVVKELKMLEASRQEKTKIESKILNNGGKR